MAIAVAHRGDPIGHRENTLDAFESARQLGADMVELDCKLTRDGQVVVLHDDTLDRLWRVHLRVSDVDWDELRQVNVDGYRVPSLAEVLSAVALPVMVDVASSNVMEAAWVVVEAAGAAERCVFAGNANSLVRLRQLSGAARIALTWDRRARPSEDLLAATRPEWFNPFYGVVDPNVVGREHEAGRAVSVWTVDAPRDIEKVLGSGVDAVISNQVARLVAAVAGRAPGRGTGRQARPAAHTDLPPSSQSIEYRAT